VPPDSPQVAEVRKQAASWLLAEGDRRLKVEDYEGALAHYEKAASYGADADALRRKQVGIKEQQIQALIDSKRFQEAEVALVKWEASGDAPQATLRALEKLKQARRAEAHQREWKRITFLVSQKRFNDAESALSKWEATGDTPGNLDELKAYLQLQKDAELKRMKAERRRKKEEEEKRRRELQEGVWTDPKTGLAWQRRYDGTKRNWDNAKRYCQSLSLGGLTGWRLPNKEELQSIVDTSRKNPAINPTHFPDTKPLFHWSSTTIADGTPEAWGVSFYDGYMDTDYKNSYYHVRCVRNAR